MFTELYNRTDREFRRLELLEKMVERRRQSLAATGNASRTSGIARKLYALSGTTRDLQAEGRA